MYLKEIKKSVQYTIVYDLYIGGCSQQRLQTLKTFESVEEADKYRWASSYCSPPTSLKFRVVFNRLSDGTWEEKSYTTRIDRVEELEKLSYEGRAFSPETFEKVNAILKKHDKWRNK